MPSHLDSIFGSIFHWFLPPISIPWTFKVIVFPFSKNYIFFFLKNCFSKLASIFVRCWCQHASILPPKIHQNPSKNRFQDASFFRSIFASIFLRFCFDFRSQLGAMLAAFSLKTRRGWTSRGWFMLGLSSFSVFWASWPPLGALWARFGTVRASILEVFGAHFLSNFQVSVSYTHLTLPTNPRV